MKRGEQRREQVGLVQAEDLERIKGLLAEVGGQHVVWGAQNLLDVWVAEAHMEAQRKASQRLLVATWALVGATVGLVLATVGLLVVSS